MNKNKNKGFSLIELTIVLIIGGLIVAGAANAFHLWLMQHRLDVTKERIATIEGAVVSYVQDNGDLPCAAPRDADRSDPGYGRETDCAGAVATGTVRVNGRGGRKVRIGAVPVRTLDLADDYRMDGWYNSFTYAVTESLASDNPVFDSTQGAIAVIDENDVAVITPDGTALYAVISHGYQTDCASGIEAENCDDDATFRTALFADGSNSEFFDNFLTYATDIEGSTMSNIERCNEKGMDFAPNDPDADADGCIYSPSLADISCSGGQFMTGFSGGNVQCASPPNPPAPPPPPPGPSGSCPSGEVVVGFNSDGSVQCAASGGGGAGEQPPSCPSGQTWNGTQCVSSTPTYSSCAAGYLQASSGESCWVDATAHNGTSGTCDTQANMGSCSYQCQNGSWRRLVHTCAFDE